MRRHGPTGKFGATTRNPKPSDRALSPPSNQRFQKPAPSGVPNRCTHALENVWNDAPIPLDASQEANGRTIANGVGALTRSTNAEHQ
jgi:hypothetical protein